LKAEKVYLCYKDERWKERKRQKTRKSEIEKNGKQPTTWAPSLVECKKNGLHVKLHCLLPSLWPAPHKSLYLLGHASCAPSLVWSWKQIMRELGMHYGSCCQPVILI
jgi:hypothetical protein